MLTSSADDNGEVTPFWKQRGWQMAAAFLAVALIMSLVAFAKGERKPGNIVSEEPRGPLSQSLKTGERPRGCATDDSKQAKPKSPPPDVQWRTIGGTRVPVSATAGPKRSSGAVLWCFAHTPMGAVMAAHVIPSQMTGPHWRTVAEEQIVAGFRRDLFVSQRGSLSDAVLESRKKGTYTGFMVSEYSDTSATVSEIIRSPDGPYFSTEVHLQWSGGDWKVNPVSDGGLHSGMSSVNGTDGFVQWEVRNGL
jgi:hypothetical protein